MSKPIQVAFFRATIWAFAKAGITFFFSDVVATSPQKALYIAGGVFFMELLSRGGVEGLWDNHSGAQHAADEHKSDESVIPSPDPHIIVPHPHDQ